METINHPSLHHADEDDSTFESSMSDVYSRDDDEDSSTFASSESSGSSGLDSVGRMLVQLEYSDESLTDLLIDCKTMDKKDSTYVERFLPVNTCLKKLRLQCGNRTSHRQIFHRVVSGLKGNSSINYIEIQGAIIDREAANWLIPSFSRSQPLKHIRMVNCNFVGSGLAILFIAIQHNKCIRHLTFLSCDWEEHDADIVASSLPFMILNSLSLVDTNIAADSWPYLFRKIEECRELIHLDISRNELGHSSIHLLARSLKSQTLVSKLSLSKCGLDNQCMKELAKDLRNYSTLSSLDLSKNNQLSDKGVIYLIDLMKFNNSISEMKVDECSLNKQSLNAIESGLRYNNSFMKNFFSETTSQAIFGVVDTIEQIDIAETTRNLAQDLSFDSESSPRKEEMKTSRQLRSPQRTPKSSNSKSGKISRGRNSAGMGRGKTARPATGDTRRVLL
ncbi:hypothetical protein ACHAXR_003703 [Thalassiosira sp. AJA248-18]